MKATEDKLLTITDVYPVEILQGLQDSFAAATNVFSVITYPDGRPVVQTTQPGRILNEIAKKLNLTTQGQFPALSLESSANIQRSFEGRLWHAATRIIIEDRHVATWLIFQFNHDALNELICGVSQLGIDLENYSHALSEIPRISVEQFQNVARLISSFANEISAKGNQALELLRSMENRKKAEKAMLQSALELRSFVENCPHGIFRAAAEKDKFLNVNPALIRMSGYSSSSDVLAIKLSSDLFLESEEYQRVLGIAAQTKQFSEIETQWKCKDGTPITVRISGRQIKDPDGTDHIIEGIAEDTTEHKRMEQQLHVAQKMATVGRIAGGVAHDFNNVLMTIATYTDLISQAEPQNCKIQRYTKEIQESTLKAISVTRKLLAFTHQQMIVPEVLDVNAIIKEMHKILGRALGEDTVVRISLEEPLGQVLIDCNQLEQIILNLMANSRDAMPKGGELTIHTANVTLDSRFCRKCPEAAPGSFVMLHVTDTNMAMNTASEKRGCDPCNLKREPGRETGLGIASIYENVKQAGGFILREQNATLKIFLPTVTTVEHSQPIVEVEPSFTEGRVILVVEDEPALRSGICEYLQDSGYKVLNAADGQEALEISNTVEHIDAVVTDLVMPGMDGVELSEKLREDDPRIRIIYMSGYYDRVVEDKPGTMLLRKPFALKTLASKLREQLDADS